MPTSAEIQTAELTAVAEKLLSSPAFQRSRNLQKLLRFVVNEESSGRGEMLTGKRIAIDGLGRRTGDLEADGTLVRVEMARLRRVLDRQAADKPRSPAIEIPKGQYRPRILKKPLKSDQIGLLVTPLMAEDKNDLIFAAGLSAEIQGQLSRFGEFRLVDGSGIRNGSDKTLLQRCRDEFDCSYLLRGNALADGTVNFQLWSTIAGKPLWTYSQAINSEPASFCESIAHVAQSIIPAITGPEGAIITDALLTQQEHLSDQSGVDCILQWHRYRLVERSADSYMQLADNTRELLLAHPDSSMGWAIHAYLTLDRYVYRLDINASRSATVVEARASAERALALDATNPTAYYVYGLTQYYLDEVEEFATSVRQGLTIAPNSIDLLHHGGTLMFLGGLRDEGLALVRRADMSYHTSLGYQFSYVLQAYLTGQMSLAHELICSVDANEGWYLGLILRAMVEYRCGNRRKAFKFLTKGYSACPQLLHDEEEDALKWIKDDEFRQTLFHDWLSLRDLWLEQGRPRG